MTVYQSILAYDGTGFQGFQRLGTAAPTVQGALEQALRRLGWTGRSIRAAGRTDAGVHARGQVVDYDLMWRHAPERLTAALNAQLPAQIAVRHTRVAPPGFHPRFSARRRRYRYTLLCSPAPDPLGERFAWRLWPAPDVERMARAASGLVGAHDFGALGRAPIPGGHTRRTVFGAAWHAAGPAWAFEIEADAFLHRMVRRLVALLVEVGAGRIEPEQAERILAEPGQVWQGRIAPPHGLCLEAVIYDEVPAEVPGSGV